MIPRLALSQLAVLALGACAVTETRELARASWQDDPTVQAVLDNELTMAAENQCPGGWSLVSTAKAQQQGRHVTRWTVNCTDPRW